MTFSLTWLPDVLKAAGLKVALEEGWENRGRGNVGEIKGVICHHTAGGGPERGNMPSLGTLKNGRKASHGQAALPGPLAQLGLGRDGTFFVIAAGRAIHAGRGSFKGLATGNSSFIGIEAENTGKPTDPWPAVQLEAYQRGVAAILKHLQRDATFCCGHREYALPKGRKVDPSFDMEQFRARVAAILDGTAPALVMIPAAEPPVEPGGPAGRPTLRRGSKDELVKTVQQKVGVDVDGKFGPRTEAAVRAFQRDHELVPDGIVGPKTWQALDALIS
jgi:N-acetylmuramoyl-L-alanine amidase/Putative peptidoglycan binding domain